MRNTTRKSGKNDETSLQKAVFEAARAWPSVKAVLFVPKSKTDYKRAVQTLDLLLDEGGADENHPLAALVDVLGTLIADYEDKHIPDPPNDPVANLKYLMAQHKLTQKDLPEIGSQGVVSEVLHGKRSLNVRQITALSKRFQVSPSLFIGS